jgi:hypothetical protein
MRAKTVRPFLTSIFALCGAATLGLGCGELPSDASETVSSPLLAAPGPFYKTAPDFGFCGNSSGVECHAGYSFNSKGAKPTFERRAAGVYRVTFENLAPTGNAQVVGIMGNSHCNLSGQSASGTGVALDLVCRAPSGALVDSKFALSYYRDANVGGPLGGYATVNGFAPFALSNTWNSTGQAVTVASLGTGAYRVTFPGQQSFGDNAQVTAVNTSAAYCSLGGWAAVAGGVGVDVRCFNATGVPVASNFSVSWGRNVRGEPRNALATGTQGALMLVGANAVPDPVRNMNTCSSGSNTASFASNLYTETYHAVTTFQGEVPLISIVTGVSPTGGYCTLQHLPFQGVQSDSRGFVTCFLPSGAPAPVAHSSMFIIQDHGGC